MMFNIRLFLNIVTNSVPINLVLLWKLRRIKNENNLSSRFSFGEIENVQCLYYWDWKKFTGF